MTDEIIIGQVGMFDQDLWSGKTFPELLVPDSPKEQTFKRFSQRSSESRNQILPMCLCLTRESGANPDACTMKWADGAWLGEFTMHSFGTSPNEEFVCLLSQILEAEAPQKYYLSEKACEGILRRAERRGKALPKPLEEALLMQSHSKNEQESPAITGDHENRVTDYTVICMDVGWLSSSEDSAGALLSRQYKDPPIITKSYQEKVDSSWKNWNGEEVTGTLSTRNAGGA